MQINGKELRAGMLPYVVAEIGGNHCGSVDICKALIGAAKHVGADAVKLQKRDLSLMTKAEQARPYDNENSYGATYGEHRQALEFNEYQYRLVQEYAKEVGITLFATAFDIPSADFLRRLDMPAYKIASGCYTDMPLIEHIVSFGMPVIISIPDIATDEDLDRLNRVIDPRNTVLLHCVPLYPCPADLMNLGRIFHIRRHGWNLPKSAPDILMGVSDHYSGILSGVLAYSKYGAVMIEKHFTLSRSARGTDHAFSLEPKGLEKMVSYLTEAQMMCDVAYVDRDKRLASLAKMAKGIYPKHPIPEGAAITEGDIHLKSPAKSDALPPWAMYDIVGHVAINDLSSAYPVRAGDVA